MAAVVDDDDIVALVIERVVTARSCHGETAHGGKRVVTDGWHLHGPGRTAVGNGAVEGGGVV